MDHFFEECEEGDEIADAVRAGMKAIGLEKNVHPKIFVSGFKRIETSVLKKCKTSLEIEDEEDFTLEMVKDMLSGFKEKASNIIEQYETRKLAEMKSGRRVKILSSTFGGIIRDMEIIPDYTKLSIEALDFSEVPLPIVEGEEPIKDEEVEYYLKLEHKQDQEDEETKQDQED